MTREREREQSDGQETVEVEVAYHGKYLGKVKVKKGATLQDVLDELKKKYPEINWNEVTIMLNGKQIKIEDGKPKENPVITENSVLALLKRFRGGK